MEISLNLRVGFPVTEKLRFRRLKFSVKLFVFLDNFTNLYSGTLQRNFTAEFTARQRQYEFYRDKLLTLMSSRRGQLTSAKEHLGKCLISGTALARAKSFWKGDPHFIRYTDVYNHRTLRKKGYNGTG